MRRSMEIPHPATGTGDAAVSRWGWDAVSCGVRVDGVPAAHRDMWRRCNDRDVRAAVGVLARFGALRLDGPPDAYVVALTRWDAPRCPHAGEVRPGRRSPAEAHRSLRHRSLPRAEPDLSGRAR